MIYLYAFALFLIGILIGYRVGQRARLSPEMRAWLERARKMEEL